MLSWGESGGPDVQLERLNAARKAVGREPVRWVITTVGCDVLDQAEAEEHLARKREELAAAARHAIGDSGFGA